MSHFSDAQWLEFASHTVSPAQKGLMDAHLADGCDECRSFSVMWAEIVEINRRELNYHPPAAAVRSAKAIFEPEASWRSFPTIAQAAHLIFDSFRALAPVAVRGSAASSRQLLQEATPFMVDLRMDYEPTRKRVRLIGQILNSVEPGKSVSGVEVFLLNGESLVSRVPANTSGEFDLEFDDEEGNQLFIDVRGQKVIEIEIPTSPTKRRGTAAGAE
jgi:hypothetical protein